MDNIALMRTFAAVVEEGSFVAAAKRLRMTPQLVSKYVLALESDLGVTLLNRTTRQISKTEAGHSFYTRCVPLLEEYEAMRADVQQEHAEPRGHLRISVPLTFGQLYMADAIRSFSEAYPKVTVEMHLADRFVNLLEENIDVALRIGELPHSSLVARRITSTDSVICASPAYFRRAGTPVRAEELEGHECLKDTNFSPPDRWDFLGSDGPISLRVSGRFTVSSATAAIDLAKSGAGVLNCPRLFVLNELQAGELVEVLPEVKTRLDGVFALFHENRRPAAKNRVFLDFIAARFRRCFGAVASVETYRPTSV